MYFYDIYRHDQSQLNKVKMINDKIDILNYDGDALT